MKIDSQIKGGHHNSSEFLTFENPLEADLFFEKVKKVFLNINSWRELFGEGTEFQLTNEKGSDLERNVAIGDLVKIKIPGPKSSIGDGSDWVKIVDVTTAKDTNYEYCIVLSPHKKPGINETAHFFESEAKNYFFIKKIKNTISAEVLNIFMNVQFDERGKLTVLPPTSKAGDYVKFLALMDLLVCLTACSAEDSNGGSFKPIHWKIEEKK